MKKIQVQVILKFVIKLIRIKSFNLKNQFPYFSHFFQSKSLRKLIQMTEKGYRVEYFHWLEMSQQNLTLNREILVRISPIKQHPTALYLNPNNNGFLNVLLIFSFWRQVRASIG